MTRLVIADLEAGDFCIKEKTSLEKSIEDYKKLNETNKAQINNLQQRLNSYDNLFAEKEKQIDLCDKKVDVLEKEKKVKFWSGVTFGAAGGALATVLLLLL